LIFIGRSRAAALFGGHLWIYGSCSRYTRGVSKHLVDIDEQALRAARAELGTQTIKEKVNRALRLAGSEHGETIKQQLDVLAGSELVPREQAWR
jgi:Arc/MetJ family transcription regulator